MAHDEFQQEAERLPALPLTWSHHQKYDEVADCSDALSYIDLDDHLHFGFHGLSLESPVATGRLILLCIYYALLLARLGACREWASNIGW